MGSAEIVRFLKISRRKGSGTEEDPYRTVTEYWDLDGNRIFCDEIKA